jgi:hypothetical protein
MCLKFGFVIFWQKDFGAKAAHKMLVKLTLMSLEEMLRRPKIRERAEGEGKQQKVKAN